MIAQELEVSLHMAFVEARQKQHEFITVEHLLLAMLDNPSAQEVLKACGVDLDELRGVLTDFISEHTPRLAADPTGRERAGFAAFVAGPAVTMRYRVAKLPDHIPLAGIHTAIGRIGRQNPVVDPHDDLGVGMGLEKTDEFVGR